MIWIRELFFKALNNSSMRKIQIQFLGILFVVAMTIVGYQYYIKSLSLYNTIIVVGIIIIISGIFYRKPMILKPLLFIWLLIGLFLGEITSTIILAFIFYFLFFPITFILRFKNRKKEINSSRWISTEKNKIDYNKLY